MMDHAQIRRLAQQFRSAIERCDRRNLGPTLSNFPRSSCGDASLLLGRFLLERGATSVREILGERGPTDNGHSHSWLLVDGSITDITADQFEDMTDAVIVAEASAWHDTFDRRVVRGGDYRVYDQNTVRTLDRAYATIIGRLED